MMPDQPPSEPELLHQFKNHLSIVVGFCDVLLGEMEEADPRRSDIVEIHKAARAAMALIPRLAEHLR